MYVVAVGNAFDGMTFYGPFSNTPECQDWIEENILGEEYTIVSLEDPSNV